MRRSLAMVLVVAAVLVAGACNGNGNGGGNGNAQEVREVQSVTDVPDGSPEVQVRGLRYTPNRVEVEVGEVVVWRFEDGSIPHDVYSRNWGIRSPILTNDTWAYEFDRAGTFEYICSIHPAMRGTVVVS